MRTAQEIRDHDIRLTAIELVIETLEDLPYSWRYPKGRHWKRLVKDVQVYSMPSIERVGSDRYCDVSDEVRRVVKELSFWTLQVRNKDAAARCERFTKLAREEYRKRARTESSPGTM